MSVSGGWDAVRASVRSQIGPSAYDAWFRTLAGRWVDGRLVLACPDGFTRDWIRERYAPVLQRVLPPGCAVEYELAEPSEVSDPRPTAAAPPEPVASSTPFDSFVPGPGNALALEAARAVTRAGAGRCNPLFLCAGSGLGKTHLCSAIVGEVGVGALYRSAEEFTHEVTQAIRTREMNRVRQRYRRSLNVLILEDLQFLTGKTQTQVELFHTLDHLLREGRPVVLSADRVPGEIQGLDPRLVSRMASGLVAPITPPEHPARLQILREKAARGGVRLPEPCLELLASRPVANVRDLLAGLNQVVARASLLQAPIDVPLVMAALAAVDVPGGRRSIEEIAGRVARAYGLSAEDLRSRSRRRAIVRPRQFAMYLCRRYTDASLKDIGRAFNRDHSSVMYAVDVVERRVLEQPQLRYELEALTRRV